MLDRLIRIFTSILAIGIQWYVAERFFCVPLNPYSWQFCANISISLFVLIVIWMFRKKEPSERYKDQVTGLVIAFLAITIIIGVVGLVSTPVFKAKSYASILKTKTTGTISKELQEISAVVLENAEVLANKKFKNVECTLILYNGIPYKVATTDSASEYIKVNITTLNIDQKSTKITKKEALKKVHNKYLTKILGNAFLEIDDAGKPYWIVQCLKNRALFGNAVIEGIILVDQNGEMKEYKISQVPKWVDNVFDDEYLIEKYKNSIKYKKGFLKSLTSEIKDIKYFYFTDGKDIWIYIPNKDPYLSGLGLFINKRTGNVMEK